MREPFLLYLLLLLLLLAMPAAGGEVLRVATFNASMHRAGEGELAGGLRGGGDEQGRKVAAILQAVRPDVVLINEFDFDATGAAASVFREQYLQQPQHGQQPIDYPFAYSPPVNTGVPSGADLDNNGTIGGPGDAHGWGEFPGQYGMLVLSRYPIDQDAIRDFQTLRWRDSGHRMPRDYYSEAAVNVLRLSSKNHVDVPVRVGGATLHLLISHPTPPVFDGPEDRNGLRNHAEITFWKRYISPAGAIPADAAFVILGDMNADPHDGESVPGAIQQLLEHPRVQDPRPTSDGGVVDARQHGGLNAEHTGDPALDTADFQENRGPGNLRVDYVLPSRNLVVLGSGVFWPSPGEPGHAWLDASDHRLVWVDLALPIE